MAKVKLLNEAQIVELTNTTGGTFTLTFGGSTTNALAFDAQTIDVQIALLELPTIGSGNVSVSGHSGGPWTVTFKGMLGQQPLPLIAADSSSLIGVDESQTVTISATGGTFTLTFGGQTTTDIAYNANSADLQAALVALSSVGNGNAAVIGPDGGPWTVSFAGTLSQSLQALMTGSASGLTGGSHSLTIEEVVTGSPAAVVIIESITGGAEPQFSTGSSIGGAPPAVPFSGSGGGPLGGLRNLLQASPDVVNSFTNDIGGDFKCYPGRASPIKDDNLAGFPFILLNHTGSQFDSCQFEGPNCQVDTWMVGVQVSVYSTTYDSCRNLANLVHSKISRQPVTIDNQLYDSGFLPEMFTLLLDPLKSGEGSDVWQSIYRYHIFWNQVINHNQNSALIITPDNDGNYTQKISITASGGTFTLMFEGFTTENIPWNASAATVQGALEALPSINVDDIDQGAQAVSVTGNSGGPWTVVFNVGHDVPLIVGDGSLLVD